MIPFYSLPGLGWASLPFTLFQQFNGTSRLPVYELNRANVTRPYVRIRPLRENTTDFRISAWRLAHAIKKADCAKGIPSIVLHFGAVGFLVEHLFLFDWNSDNLRLNNGMADYYADFIRTSLSGRVAQGMSILFMEEREYSFNGQFSTFLKSAGGQAVAGRLIKAKSSKRKIPKTPDFIFQKFGNEVALVESKGGFVTPGNAPLIKGDLREALEQLDDWDRILGSQQSVKSFAVGTYIKEGGDLSEEPSLIAFVDPEPDESTKRVSYPPDLIRRCNYAGWLAGMGFLDTSNRLKGFVKDSSSLRTRLPMLALGDRQYAFVVLSFRPILKDRIFYGENFWLGLDDWQSWPLHFFHEGMSLEIMGVEIETLNSLSKFLLTGNSEPLMHIEPISERDLPQKADEGKFFGSVYSDGTLFGELRVSSPKFGGITFEEIEL